MPNLSFGNVLKIFKNNIEDAVSYFILVESYEKHLEEAQKKDFLGAHKLDDMINMLNDKQLKHLKSLIQVFWNGKYLGHIKHRSDDFYGGEGLSDWFVRNVCKNRQLAGYDFDSLCQNGCIGLIQKIVAEEKKRTKAQKSNKDLISKYKSRLSKFDGNSIAYRQWLILLLIDHGIPHIERTYDIVKLLKGLDICYLEKLREKILNKSAVGIIVDIKHLEPYFYRLAILQIVSKGYASDEETAELSLGLFGRLKISECVFFRNSQIDLVDKIDNVIEQKRELVDEKLNRLSTSYDLYEDVVDVLRSVGNTDDLYLKDVIAEYSKPGTMGEAFNEYLRKAAFLKKLAESKTLASEIPSSRNKILKAYEYFVRHVTNKEYTVYRGMGIDGLFVLLKTANPKVDVTPKNTAEEIVTEINKKQPVVFDEGFVSTSLNKGVSAKAFGGKARGGVFFTIRIPKGSKALVLDYEGIRNIPKEEELLLASKTKIKINSIKLVRSHFEIDAEVIK